MAEPINGFIVTLEDEASPEYAGKLMEAIGLLKHVINVQPAPADNIDVHLAREQAKWEFKGKLYDVLQEMK